MASSSIRELWAELFMDRERTLCIDDVCDAFEEDDLRWCYKGVYSLIEPYQKTGHLDEYVLGMSDEGEADGEQEPWDDRDGPSPAASDPDEKVVAESHAPAMVEGDLSIAQAAEAAHHASLLLMADRALEASNNLPDPRVAHAIGEFR